MRLHSSTAPLATAEKSLPNIDLINERASITLGIHPGAVFVIRERFCARTCGQLLLARCMRHLLNHSHCQNFTPCCAGPLRKPFQKKYEETQPSGLHTRSAAGAQLTYCRQKVYTGRGPAKHPRTHMLHWPDLLDDDTLTFVWQCPAKLSPYKKQNKINETLPIK